MAAGGSGSHRPSDTMRMRTTRIGLIGCGAVGSEVCRILLDKSAHLTRKTGRYLMLSRVVDREPHRPRDVALPDGLLTDDLEGLLADREVPVVVVLVGGAEEAVLVRRLIAAGKSIVTADAGLLATDGAELVQLAREAGVTISFGASVGEGLPLVTALRDELVPNDISHFFGILNVTANFVLTAMEQDQTPLDQALAEAERLGYVEPDPLEDVDGHDATHKLAILANLCFHTRIDQADIYFEGIDDLTLTDLALADALGFKVKLLATGIREEQQLDLRVHPALVPAEHPLSGVTGARCALYCVGDCCGPLMFTGFAAGARPTASAVVADLVNIALKREELTFTSAEIFPVAPKAEIRDIMTRAGQYYLSFDEVMGQEEVDEIAAQCAEEGLTVAQTALVGGACALIVGPGQEDRVLAFAARQARDRGLPHKVLRVIDRFE